MTAPTSTAAPAAPTSAPVAPPRAWFVDPKLKSLTPLTVDESGRVFGHLASWRQCHVESAGMGQQCVTAPRSKSHYSRFHLGAVMTVEGEQIATGPIVLDTSHADPAWDQLSTMRHYSDTGHAVADVRVGEDRFGIWVAGGLRPTTTADQIRTLRASPLSGDWRMSGGSLELVAALAVSAPGFAIERPRALIASAGGVLAAIGIGLVSQRTATPSAQDPRSFALMTMRIHAESVRRMPRPGASTPQIERNVAAFVVHRKRKAEQQHDSALIASMSAPTALVQPWAGPVGFENQPTGDGRLIGSDALTSAQFPLPLRWAPIDNGGHDGAMAVGRIDAVSRRDDGVIWGEGVIDLGQPEGRELARQIAGGFAGGISLDLDSTESTPVELNGTTTSLTTSGRVRGATVVQIPAFEGARVQLVGSPRPGAAEAAPNAEADAQPGADGDPDCGCEPVAQNDTSPGGGQSPAPANR